MSGNSTRLLKKVKTVELQTAPSFNGTKIIAKTTINKTTCPGVQVSFDGVSVVMYVDGRTFMVPYTNVKYLELDNE